MKLRRLRLSNIRLHRSTDFIPGMGVSILHGSVGSGKSTIGQLLEWACTGKCEWLSGGLGAEDLVSANAHAGNVQVEYFDRAGELRQFDRSIPSAAGVQALQAGIYANLGVNELILTACLRPSGFFKMTPDQQRLTLWSVLGDVTDQDIHARLNGYVEDLPKLGDYYFHSLVPGALSLVKRDDHAKHIKDKLLPTIKTEVDKLEGKVGEAPPHDPSALYKPEDHEAARKVHADAEAAVAEHEVFKTALEAWKKRQEAFEKTQAEIPAWIDRINALQAREQELKANPGRPLQEIQDDIQTLVDERERLSAELSALQKEIAPRFPGGTDEVACPRGKCMRVIQQEWSEANRKKGDELVASRDETNKRCNPLFDERDTAASLLDALEEIAQKLGELATTEPHPVDPGPRPEGDENGLMELVKKAGSSAMSLARLEVLQAHQAQVQKQMAQRAADQATLEERKRVMRHLTALKDALGPRGVRADIMENKVRAFVDVVNLHMQSLGPAIAIDQTDWEVRGVIQGKQIPIALMSDSQIQRQSLAVQVELALRTGVGIVVLDRCGEMSPTEVRDCCAFILGHGLQAILMRTCQEASIEETYARFDMPGVSQFFVQSGTIVPLSVEVPVQQ